MKDERRTQTATCSEDHQARPDRRWTQKHPVWYVSVEATPYAKVGGLGDVAGELPLALSAQGAEVVLCLPLHGDLPRSGASITHEIKGLPNWVGPGMVHQYTRSGQTVLFFALPRWFGRAPIYGWTDDNERYAAFCLAVACHAAQTRPVPGLLHLQDWHTASLALLIHAARVSGPRHPLQPLTKTRTLLTIHSLQYQGWHNRGFPYLFDMGEGMEAIAARFQDGYQALRAGILWADALSTVSPTHAGEVLLPGGGFGLETVLQQRVAELPQGFFRGILNRLGPSWDPRSDAALPAPFSVDTLPNRAGNRSALHEV